jgi:hypothetical protein
VKAKGEENDEDLVLKCDPCQKKTDQHTGGQKKTEENSTQ